MKTDQAQILNDINASLIINQTILEDMHMTVYYAVAFALVCFLIALYVGYLYLTKTSRKEYTIAQDILTNIENLHMQSVENTIKKLQNDFESVTSYYQSKISSTLSNTTEEVERLAKLLNQLHNEQSVLNKTTQEQSQLIAHLQKELFKYRQIAQRRKKNDN